MGANEDELKRIASMGHFRIEELARLRTALSVLQDTMKAVAGSSGWTGASQDAAADRMMTMSTKYSEIENSIADLEVVISAANGTVNRAVEALNGLPDSKVPSWVHGALDTAEKTIPFPGLGPVLVGEGTVHVIEGFLGNKREEAAGAALATYQAELADHKQSLSTVGQSLPPVPSPIPSPDPQPTPPNPNPQPPIHVGPVGPTFSGNYSGPPHTGHGGPTVVEVDPTLDPGPNVDDGSTGYLPPTGTPTGTGIGGGGGGISPVVGSVVGGGVGMAGALTSARMGGGLGGSMPTVGAAPRLGSGGLLGAGGPAATGKGSVGGAGVAGGGGGAASGGGSAGGRGAGGRGGLSGAGTGAHGDKETKRRAGVGLGGPIAPKLEDDEMLAPRAAGTRAGGRDEAVDFTELGDGGE